MGRDIKRFAACRLELSKEPVADMVFAKTRDCLGDNIANDGAERFALPGADAQSALDVSGDVLNGKTRTLGDQHEAE